MRKRRGGERPVSLICFCFLLLLPCFLCFLCAACCFCCFCCCFSHSHCFCCCCLSLLAAAAYVFRRLCVCCVCKLWSEKQRVGQRGFDVCSNSALSQPPHLSPSIAFSAFPLFASDALADRRVVVRSPQPN